jgi:hypothetical protein
MMLSQVDSVPITAETTEHNTKQVSKSSGSTDHEERAERGGEQGFGCFSFVSVYIEGNFCFHVEVKQV